MKRANQILAESFGCDIGEVNESRYQATRNPIPIYTSGDFYYCVPQAGKQPPKGWSWKPYSDQWGARDTGRTIYQAEAVE